MPYQYHVYNVQDQARSDSAHEAMARMEAEGWERADSNCAFTELCILWYKPREAKPEEGRHSKKDVSPE